MVSKKVSPKVALAMILKSDEPQDQLVRCLSTIASHVDKIYITITTKDGKVDKYCNSFVIANKFGAEISWFKWIKDFAAARNYNLKQIKEDYIFWCDADDIVLGGNKLKQLTGMMEKQDIGAIFCTYYYQLSPEGFEHFTKTGEVKEEQVMIKHLRERLIKKDLYKWVGKLHETLIEKTATKKVDTKDFSVVHTAQEDDLRAALERNIEILEQSLREETQRNKRDPRTVYYLGKAYFDRHRDKERPLAKALIDEYLQTSGWEEERAQAWEYMSTIMIEEGDYDSAVRAALSGLIESPKFPSTWLQVAICFVKKGEWDKAKFWAELAGKMSMPETTLIINSRGNRMTYYEIMFGEAVERNDIDTAHKYAEMMIKLAPQHDLAKKRFEMMSATRDQRDALMAFHRLSVHLSSKGEKGKLIPLLSAVPAELVGNKMVEEIRKSIYPPKTWGKKEVIFYCGPGFEKWSPKNMNEWERVAGSEEATIRLSRELAKLGWEVTVYGNPMEDEGLYDGVTYLNYYKFNPKDTFNIMVIWRQPGLLSNIFSVKKTYLWMHDIPNPVDFTKERVKAVEKIIPLSKWHRNCLPDIVDEKFLISSNGIDLDQIKGDFKRDPYRMIYTSSYDRGLEHLLKMWPDIKKEVPQANLHIFYGWGLFDQMFHNNPERKMWKSKMEKLMKQPGITEYGKVGQDRIIEEYFKSGILAYPTHFGEISFISGMKAQACGAIPITVDYAAVHETVQYGVKVEGDIYDQETKEKYKKALIKALKDHEWQEKERKPMMKWAREKFGWDRVAKRWNHEFRK